MDQDYAFQKILKTTVIKIFVNYTQNMAIINTLNLNWKDIALNMFKVHQAVSGSLHQIISLECFIRGISINIYIH